MQVKDNCINKQELLIKLPALGQYARVCFALGTCEYANLNTADVICVLFGQGSYFDMNLYVNIALCIDSQDSYMWFDSLIPFLLEWHISPDLPYLANFDECSKLVIKTIFDTLMEEGYDMTLVRVIKGIEEECGIPAF